MPSKPGQTTLAETTEVSLIWGKGQPLRKGIVLSGTARDAVASPTTNFRPGNLLGMVTATGEYEQWDTQVTTGVETLRGVWDLDVSVLDDFASNEDQVYSMIVRSPLKAAGLKIKGAALVGHADEYLARQILWNMGCPLDDDPQGYLAGANVRTERVTAAGTDTLTHSQTGTRLIYSNAAAVAVQLPAAQPGVWYDIIREGDEAIVLNGTSDLIVGDSLASDTVTFTTVSEHIGVRLRVEGIYVSTTPLWLVTFLPAPLGVGLDAWTYAIA